MPTKTTKFLPFSNPAALVNFYTPELLDGRISLYPWQTKVSKMFAEEHPEKGRINEIDVVAANSSGKSSMLIGPCALWSACQFDLAETVVTSASGSQLDRQTSRYIKSLARKMNTFHKADLYTIQDRKIVFNPTDSYIDLFATDEPTKAEGWHQREFDTAFTIIVDEAKGVPDDIFTALDRCHDAQRYLRVSSPAIGTNGYFYKAVTSGRTRVVKVTAYDCPHHITPYQIEKIIKTYGLYSPITRSIIFAEFSSTDECVVVAYDKLQKLIKLKPLLNTSTNQPLRVGGDLAAGGDENSIQIWKGNKRVADLNFREPDTTKTRDRIIQFLGSSGVPKDSEYMFFDDGGVGRSIIDMLQELGWNIKRVLNQSKAINTDRFSNRGAELWFNFATFIEYEELQLPEEDETLINQLSNRYYRQSSQGKILLESKRDAKAKGHPSPDRADATVLAFTGLVAPFYSVAGSGDTSNDTQYGRTGITYKELIEWMEKIKYGDIPNPRAKRDNSNLNIHGSYQTLLRGGLDSRDTRFQEMIEHLAEYYKSRKE